MFSIKVKDYFVFGVSFLLILSSDVNAQISLEESEALALEEKSFPALPRTMPNQQKLFVIRTTGDISKANNPRTLNQKAKGVGLVFLYGGRAPLPDKINPFKSSDVSGFMKYDLYKSNGSLTRILSATAGSTAFFLDVQKNIEHEYVFSMYLEAMDYDIGAINFKFKNEKTHVLVLGRQEHDFDRLKYDEYYKGYLKESKKGRRVRAYKLGKSLGKWGMKVLLVDKADADFCREIRVSPLTEEAFQEKILEYSSLFVPQQSKLKSHSLFNLACFAIARSKPIPVSKLSKRKLKKVTERANKVQKFIPLVTDEERNSNYIELKRMR